MRKSEFTLGEIVEEHGRFLDDVKKIVGDRFVLSYVKAINVTDEPDWTEQPSLFVRITVDESMYSERQPTAETISAVALELNQRVAATRRALLEKYPQWWPYFEFVA